MRQDNDALARLRAAVAAFLAKWPDAEKAINGAIVIASIHGCPYTGPVLQPELDALPAALADGETP